MAEQSAEKEQMCLPCWDAAVEWVDREGGTEVLRYRALHKRHLNRPGVSGDGS